MNAFSAHRVKREPVTEDALRYVIQNLRPRDREEIYALHFWDDPEQYLHLQMMLTGDMCCIWTHDGVPVSCQGVLAMWPGVWSMFAYGTDQWPRVVLSMTRHSLRFIVPALLAVNAHRVECRALVSHTESRRWIEFLGAREEAILEGYGKRREDFVLYVWRPGYVGGSSYSRAKQRLLAVDRKCEAGQGSRSSASEHLAGRQDDQGLCGSLGMD